MIYTKEYFERCPDESLRQYAREFPDQFPPAAIAQEVLTTREQSRAKADFSPLDHDVTEAQIQKWRSTLDTDRERYVRQNAEQTLADQEAQESRNARIFLQANPNFKRCQENADAIKSYLDTNRLPATLENISTVAERLAVQGKLQLNPTPEPVTPSITEAEKLPLSDLRELVLQSALGDSIL